MGNSSLTELLCFGAGDFVVDPECGEVGLLLARFNLIENDEYPPLYAWDILWSGYRFAREGQPRRSPYTEEGLKNLVLEGSFLYYKNNY